MNKQPVVVPKSTIIELRQQNENTQVLENGHYNVNLNEQNVILEEGDTLQLKSVYLDTGSVETGFIDLIPDNPQPDGAVQGEPVTTITINVGKYVMNVPSTQETTFYTTDTGTKPVINSKIRNPKFADQQEAVNGNSNRIRANTDGKPYVMSMATQSGAGTMHQITGWTIRTDDPKSNGRADPSLFMTAPAHFQISYFIANQPVSPKAVRTADFYFNPKNLSAQKKQEMAGRFVEGALTITQDILDDFSDAWFDSADLGQFSSHGEFVTPIANPPVQDADAPTIKLIIDSKYPDPNKTYSIYVFGPNTTLIDPNTLHLSPLIEPITFTLPSTRYTSSEIAIRITQEASRVSGDTGFLGAKDYISTNNPLYRSIQGQTREANPTFVPSETDDAAGLATMANGRIVFVETDIAPDQDFLETFRFNSFKDTDRNYMVGSAGGFVLEYDDQSDKFSISNIHSPLRDQNPKSLSNGAPQVRGFCQPQILATGDNTNPPSNVKFYVNKYSGIFIAGLSPPDLWKRQMKFDMGSLIPTLTSSLKKKKIGKPPVAGADQREEYLIDSDQMKLIDGQHTTGLYDGVGNAEQHSISTTSTATDGGGAGANTPRITAGSATFDTIIEFLPAGENAQNDGSEDNIGVPYIATNTDQTINIFSQGQIEDGQHDVADEGYYKVVVDSKYSNELVGANNTIRNVSAIISKFNSYGNFTSAYGEGSISYTHKGQPLTLTDFRVKILTPNGGLATDLNDRNTVFLELIKNV